jgi:hypothetical protein
MVDWWRNVLGRSDDTPPRMAIGLYLKIAYEAHRINFSLKTSCTDLVQISRLLQKGKVEGAKMQRRMERDGPIRP